MKKIKKFALIILVTIAFTTTKVQTFSNPLLSGFYPHPGICKAGNAYYIVNSSFAYYRGIPVFHSNDLLNGQQIGCTLNRPGQLNLKGTGVSRGLFVPTIRFHDQLFYILYTLIDKGGNFIFTAKDPKGPWTDAVWLPEIKGIDPFIDFINYNAYIVYNSDPRENRSLYDGRRTIGMYKFKYKNFKVISNDRSSRSIEVENPLYLQQAKTYDASDALGPCVFVTEEPLNTNTIIALEIKRNATIVFTDTTAISQMKRTPQELVGYLFRKCSFPCGCLVMTSTGIVPGNDFTLQSGDTIKIPIGNIVTLTNTVR